MNPPTSPRLAMRRLILDRLVLQARVGILPQELTAPQTLEVSITVELPSVPLIPASDEILRVFDYRHLRDIAIEEAGRGHVSLLETLAGRIAERLLAFAPVARVIVHVAKPHIFEDCDAVGVELDITKSP